MYEYLKNLLPRAKQFSKDLDEKELFNDKHWILMDDEGKKATYVFQREGLIVSLSGVPRIGTWEYISAAKSLLLTVGDDKAFLSFSFFNNALFVLKKDDDAETPWILVNKNVIPDLNIEKYLNSLLPEAERPDLEVSIELDNGMVLSIIGVKNLQNSYPRYKVRSSNEEVRNGDYPMKNKNIALCIIDSIINSYLTIVKYQTDKGELSVNQTNSTIPLIGDSVLLNNEPNITEKLVLLNNENEIKSFEIKNGIISRIIFKKDWSILIFGIVVILALLSFAIYFTKTHP